MCSHTCNLYNMHPSPLSRCACIHMHIYLVSVTRASTTLPLPSRQPLRSVGGYGDLRSEVRRVGKGRVYRANSARQAGLPLEWNEMKNVDLIKTCYFDSEYYPAPKSRQVWMSADNSHFYWIPSHRWRYYNNFAGTSRPLSSTADVNFYNFPCYLVTMSGSSR